MRQGPDPDILVDVTNAANAAEAEMLAERLTQQGIPAHALTHAGAVNPWEVGSSNPFRVAVRRCDLDRARAVIAQERADAQSEGPVDWDAVDLGEPEPGVDIGTESPDDGTPRDYAGARRSALLVIVAASVFAFGWLGLIALAAAAIIEAVAWSRRRREPPRA